MKEISSGWEQRFYRFFIFCGILVIVMAAVLGALLDPTGHLGLRLGGAAAYVFLIGLLSYWWVQFLADDKKKTGGSAAQQRPSVNDPGVLQSWSILSAAMAVQPGEVEEEKKLRRSSRRLLLLWFAWANTLALFPTTLMLLTIFGVITGKVALDGILAFIAYLVSSLFLTFLLPRRAARASESLILTPLGLGLVRTPQPALIPGPAGPRAGVRGESVIEGARHGRSVSIVAQSGTSLTHIAGTAPVFSLHSQAGKLEADDAAPQAVLLAIQGLRKAKRWEGLSLNSDGEGIQASRKSRGQNMWLYDLWLIERIFEALSKGPAVDS